MSLIGTVTGPSPANIYNSRNYMSLIGEGEREEEEGKSTIVEII